MWTVLKTIFVALRGKLGAVFGVLTLLLTLVVSYLWNQYQDEKIALKAEKGLVATLLALNEGKDDTIKTCGLATQKLVNLQADHEERARTALLARSLDKQKFELETLNNEKEHRYILSQQTCDSVPIDVASYELFEANYCKAFPGRCGNRDDG